MENRCRDLFEETKWYEQNRKVTEGAYRMKYHLMPPVGWLNDPNGLCELAGVYHVFFQYTPAAASGDGYRGWGHYTSEDMLCWNYEGLAIAPDSPYDRDGAYSGCAWTEDGRMYLYYTGNVKEEGAHDYVNSGRGANVLLVESEDGIHMGEKQLLMTNDDYPTDYSCHVRDPKVWKEECYYMLLGGRTRADKGKALLYCAGNRKDFRLFRQIAAKTPLGYMWECPDLLKIDGRCFLSVSPQGVPAEEYRYQNIYQSGYFRLPQMEEEPEPNAAWQMETDDKRDGFTEWEVDGFTEWDMGFDFYAPQTFRDSKGRRILYGWAGIPDAEYVNPTTSEGWQHCLTMPRVITQRNGRLYQNPAEETVRLRRKERKLGPGQTVKAPEACELHIAGAVSGPVELTVCEGLKLSYDGDRELVLEFLSGGSDIGAGRKVRKALFSGLHEIRMFLDVSVAEFYINGGELVMTTRLYPERYSLKIEAADTVNTLWELES